MPKPWLLRHEHRGDMLGQGRDDSTPRLVRAVAAHFIFEYAEMLEIIARRLGVVVQDERLRFDQFA